MSDNQNYPEPRRVRSPVVEFRDVPVPVAEGASVEEHQKARLETLVTLDVGPDADEETRARARQKILEGKRRIAEAVMREVRAVRDAEVRRHG